MVFDDTRNALYAGGIREVIAPSSVVLDLGSGLGVHGLLAAAAGAARVYLVEPQAVINAAKEVAQASGLGDRLVTLQSRIEDTCLPEQVDLIVSVFTGNLLFSEDLLPSLFHARDRHLKPGGHMIPDRAQLWLAPLQAPELHAKYVAQWSEPVMGFDYSTARRFAANEILALRPKEFQGSHRLGSGGIVSDLDLMTASDADCDGASHCRIEKSGLCHGLLGWIRIRLFNRWMSTDPNEPEVHWSPVMLPIDPALPLHQGEEVAMTLKRPAQGEWTWTIKASAGSRRHSTFLARTDGARELARLAPASRPGLSADGRTAARALAMLGEGMSITAVAKSLTETEALDPQQAMQQVQALALRYGGQP